MNIEIGKIIEYEEGAGYILSLSAKYFFLEKDLEDIVKINDLVVFRPENHNDINYAFFIKKLENYVKLNKDNKDVLQKVLRYLD